MAVLSLDDCDTAVSIKYGRQLGSSSECAARIVHELEPRCAQLTETCHRFLDLTAPLQLGGLPYSSSSGGEFQVTHRDFEGCLADLHIDHQFIDLNAFVADNGTISGCQEKKDFCASSPCRNGGKCREGFGTYICDCPDGAAGKDCSESKSFLFYYYMIEYEFNFGFYRCITQMSMERNSFAEMVTSSSLPRRVNRLNCHGASVSSSALDKVQPCSSGSTCHQIITLL